MPSDWKESWQFLFSFKDMLYIHNMHTRPTSNWILMHFQVILLLNLSHWHIKCLQFLYQNFSHYSFSKCIARIPMAYYTYFCMIFENSHITYFDPWECVTAHHFHKKYSDNFLCIFFLLLRKCFIFVSYQGHLRINPHPSAIPYQFQSKKCSILRAHYFHPWI